MGNGTLSERKGTGGERPQHLYLSAPDNRNLSGQIYFLLCLLFGVDVFGGK